MSLIRNFSDASYGGLTFSNISVSEDDVGTVNSFVDSSLLSMRVSNVPSSRVSTYQGPTWSSFSSGALAPGSSTTLTFSYDVSATTAGMGVNGLQQAFTVDTQTGAGISLVGVEYVYDANNNLVGQSTINLATPSATGPVAPGDFAPYAAFTSLHVQLVVAAAVDANAVAPAAVNFSIIEQGFHQTALSAQAALGDTVWEDANDNGVQDGGETGVSGVTVRLLDGTGHFTGLTTTTDANGHYAFSNLNVGTYEVQFVQPGGYSFSPTGQGTAATDSNPNVATGVTGPITLVAGQNDITIDAGLYRPAALGDYVFADTNNNGVQDSGETGIAGVTVNLLSADGSTTLGTTTTNSWGLYSFVNLTPGAYEVQFVQPIGYNFSPTGAGTPATDSNPDQTTGITTPVTLVSGQNDITIDAGLVAQGGSHGSTTAALGDYVFEDVNDNGVQDAGDTGIAGVTVNLLDASGATVLGTTVTDGSGLYSFTSLAAGTYEVAFLQPAGYAFSPTGAGTPDTDSNPNQGTGVTGPISLADGQVDNSIDAGLYRPAALGDYVFEDANANGVQDAGDTGIAGVTVNLLDASGGTVLGTTTTDGVGHYAFTDLAPGSYEVAFANPGGYSFSPTGAGTPATDSNPDRTTGITTPVTLVSGQNDTTIDAGLYRLAALGDYVFNDLNANGIQDSGDTGVSGITVNLLDATGATVLGTTTTNATGYYSFTSLTPGAYEVQFVKPLLATFSPTGAGTPATDSNPDQTTGITAPVTLVSGQNDITIDAGLVLPPPTPPPSGSIGDYVWNDCNWNGIQDGCEVGISGVTVNLLSGSGSSVLATTTTDATGHYQFSGLAVGTYSVQFVAPAGTTFSAGLQGTDVTLDSNVISIVGASGTSSPVTLAAGQAITTIDAGLHTDVGLHEVSVFQSITAPLTTGQLQDLNGCGATYGPSAPAHFTEPGPIITNSGTATPLYTGPSGGQVDSLVFVLSATPVLDPSALITLSFGSSVVVFHAMDFASSLADGFPSNISGIANGAVNGIKFTNAVHTAVEVTFNAPLTSFGGKDSVIGNLSINSSVDLRVDIFGVHNGVIVSNAANSGAIGVNGDSSFGDCCSGGGGTSTASLGDLVFSDCNGNGVQDAGESGVSGVTVQLLNAAGTSVLSTTTTDSSGHYLFSGLAAGTYTAQFVAPGGSQFTAALQGTDTAKDSNPDATGRTGQVTLTAGQSDLTIDAGIYKPACLGDLVFWDSNGNGVRDWCEGGVSGVTVKLLDATGTTVLATTTTNASGLYSFNNLTPGVYEVQFIAPTGKTFTAALQGCNTSTDSNPNPATGITGPITLTCGECNTTIDAGLVTAPTTAKLGDLVFDDCNANGIQDAGESGVSCVTVKLLNAAGTSVLRTTTTDSSGHYLFNNLAPGTYTVQFVAPGGSLFSPSLQGSDTAKDSNPNAAGKTGQITLTAGQSDLSIDAGVYQAASLGNVVFWDGNGNGVRDWCDSGVSGVTVKLLDSTGNTVLSITTTNSSGLYSFTGLTPGSYRVQFVAPAGKGFTAQNQGGNDSIDSDANTTTGKTGVISLTCGEVDNSVDAGLVANQTTGAIGDFVFNDANHNGIQDAGESGISGVTVKLLNASNSSVLTSTTTNSSGHYLFSGLNAGSYVVQFVAPSGYTASPSLRGSDSTKDSDASTTTGKSGTISLSAGQTNLTIDAGLYRTASNGGCGGWTYYKDDSHGGYCSGATSWSSSDDHSGGQYGGGGNWGCAGWNGNGWTDGWSNLYSGPGEMESVCGSVKQVEFTYQHSDCVGNDALWSGIGNSSGHNGQSMCFIQITDKSGDHSWGSRVLGQGTVSDGDKICTDSSVDLTSCGGKLFAHVYASAADCAAGRSAIQEISFDVSGGHNIYLGSQVGSLCLTGYSGTHGSALTNW